MTKDRKTGQADLDKLLCMAEDVADWNQIDPSLSAEIENDPDDIAGKLESIAKLAGTWRKHHQPASAGDSEPGQALFLWGHLKVVEQIGTGSFGDVLRAYDPVLDREVALKLRKAEISSPIYSRAFIQEARRLAKVRHPNVLAVHGAAIHDQRVGLWADLIDGHTLAQRDGDYDAEGVMAIARAVADALAAVHGAGLVHGDVKPANVMVDASKQITLMDFGAGGDQSSPGKKAASASGTPMFMAPELFSCGALTPACDIYSLGVMLFRLLTGKYLFDAENLADTRAAHKLRQYRKLAPLRPDLPRSLTTLVGQLINPDAHERPSAAAVVKQLDWIAAAPQRRKRRLINSSIIASLCVAALASGIGYFQSSRAWKAAVQEQQRASAVNEFLQQMLNSASLQGNGKDARVLDILNYAAAEAEEEFGERDQIMVEIHRSLGHAYLALQLNDQAAAHFRHGIDLQASLKIVDHNINIDSQIGLARTQYNLGNFSRSENVCNDAEDQASVHLGPASKAAIMAKVCRARALTSKEEYAKAIKLLERLLPLTASPRDGLGDVRYLVLSALAFAHRSAVQFEQAEKYARAAISWLEDQPRPERARQLAAKGELAFTLGQLGKTDEALDVVYEIEALNLRLFGEDSVATMGTLMNLGGLLQQSGQAERALEVLQRAETIALSVLGAENDRTVHVRINLANARVSTGDLQGGKELMRDTLTVAYRQIGESTVPTLMLEYNLAELLNNLGEYAQAEVLGRKNRAKMLQKFGPDHPFALLSEDNLAVSLSNLGNPQTALAAHQRVIDGLVKSVGPKSPYTILAMGHYADSLELSGSHQQAIQAYRELIALSIEVLGEDHPDTIKAVKKLNAITST